jgi:hypothetical protein
VVREGDHLLLMPPFAISRETSLPKRMGKRAIVRSFRLCLDFLYCLVESRNVFSSLNKRGPGKLEILNSKEAGFDFFRSLKGV